MIMNEGDKALIVYRRLFESDQTRFFVGTVDGYEGGVAKVTGYSFLKDQFAGTIIKKNELRTKILAVASGTLIIYQLPAATDLKEIQFESKPNGELWLSAKNGFRMNLTEREYHHDAKGRKISS